MRVFLHLVLSVWLWSLIPAPLMAQVEYPFQNRTIEDFEILAPGGVPTSDVFRLEDGTLTVTARQTAWLMTKESYRNFRFCAEVCYPGTEFVDSGLVLRASWEDSANCVPSGIEVQLKCTDAGDLWGCVGAKIEGDSERSHSHVESETGHAYCRVGRFREVTKFGPNEWNTLEVTCFEDMILVRMNGKIVNWCHSARNVPGRIGIQTKPYPAGRGQILYRNVSLERLLSDKQD